MQEAGLYTVNNLGKEISFRPPARREVAEVITPSILSQYPIAKAGEVPESAVYKETCGTLDEIPKGFAPASLV